jgi:excisionase family DNA binding protein
MSESSPKPTPTEQTGEPWADKKVFTTGEAAQVCKVSQQTIIRCFDSGRLNGFRVPGSKFRRIPRDELMRFMKANGIPIETLEGQKRRVLVVDDDPQIIELFQDVLGRDGRFDARYASTGYDAGLLTESFRPHVMLLDYMLPDINGNIVCERIRSHPDLASTHIILISGVIEPSEIDRLKDAGADEFVQKPFNIERLLERIERAAGGLTATWARSEQTRMTPTQAPSPTREDGSCSPEHVEAILRRVDALPTLSPIATRVLQLSGSDESDLREIARLVQADPSLSAKLLALCRRSNLGLNVTTVERAVVVLGLDAVRAAVLSISVFELMRATGDGPEPSGGAGFDRRGLWMHSVAAACAAEMIAERLPAGPDRPEPAEAFVCGLLHDLGKIALDLIIPKSFARIVEVCDRQRADFARVARRVVGMDHHVVGKRLGEHWGLPLMIRDAMWLHGQSPEGLPGLPHDGVLRLVIAGDRLAQRLRLGWSGEHEVGASPAALLAGAGLERPDVEGFTAELHERVERHALALGLMREDDPRLLARALASANEELGRMSELLDRRARRADASAAALLEIEAFLDQAPSADGLSHTLELVGRSAERVTGARVPGVLWQRRREAPVELVSLAPGRGSRAGRLEGPAGSTESLADALSGSTPSVLAGALAMAAAGSLGATERAAGWSLHPVAPGNGVGGGDHPGAAGGGRRGAGPGAGGADAGVGGGDRGGGAVRRGAASGRASGGGERGAGVHAGAPGGGPLDGASGGAGGGRGARDEHAAGGDQRERAAAAGVAEAGRGAGGVASDRGGGGEALGPDLGAALLRRSAGARAAPGVGGEPRVGGDRRRDAPGARHDLGRRRAGPAR